MKELQEHQEEVALKRVILNAVLELHSWLDSMKLYTDSMYGKKRIKDIHDGLLSKLLMQPADGCYVSVMDVIWEPKRRNGLGTVLAYAFVKLS